MQRLGFLGLILKKRKLIVLKKASFHKYADLDQLFRAMLAVFELWLVADHVGRQGGRGLLLLTLSAYLGFTVSVMVFQNVWPRLRGLQGIWSCMIDTAFFSMFLALGGDFSHVFNLNFLFVPFCIGLKVGSRVGAPYLWFNLLAFVGVDLYDIYSRQAGLGRAAAWTAFIGVFGYFLARWGSSIRRDVQRQQLLRDIREFVEPGVGIHVACDHILTELCRFLNAESCSVLLYRGNEDETARTVRFAADRTVVEVDEVPKQNLKLLRALDDESIYLFIRRDGFLESYLKYSGSEWNEVEPLEGHEILGIDDPNLTFLTVPLRGPHETYGRLFVRGSKTRQLTFDDAHLVRRLVESVAIYLENLRLSQKIADDAAEIERQRIALDIHDSVVQPYLAVQMGISALRNKVEAHAGVMMEDVERLDSLVELGITDLRDYVRGLRDGGASRSRTLFNSVRRYAEKFGEATGITVVFEHDEFEPDELDGRLSADIFQMICEGVSNARKHTSSSRILVELSKREREIYLSITDEGGSSELFLPRSISHRAALNGGIVNVASIPDGGMKVEVEIPRVG